MEFKIIEKKDSQYEEVDDFCQKIYWACNLQEEGKNFGDECPEFYTIVLTEGKILATLGSFVGELPIDKIMLYDRKHAELRIELGRLSFYKKPKNDSEYAEIKEITRFLVANYYNYVKKFNNFSRHAFYFQTHRPMVWLLTNIFGREFITPLNSFLIWENISKEAYCFYKLFPKKAGLFKVNVHNLPQAITYG